MGPDEKLMMEKMGFSNFTAKWQTNLEEKEEVEVKEERHTFRFEVFIWCTIAYSSGVWFVIWSLTLRIPMHRTSVVCGMW